MSDSRGRSLEVQDSDDGALDITKIANKYGGKPRGTIKLKKEDLTLLGIHLSQNAF
jgi:hypothetical protein